ncbi:hypothetical protein [Acidianus brierleyi]|uniref:Uncharacterized protein n=1 Tax=Acidianus brierleyi TaxID=41673 RepID=A0A2U9IDH5_9CREN|nr:hypothetical protein [Acidianus brierleyi]AWR94071.1 hypothetical protein DFR85_05125 [Acidianus brierleyi]
MATTIKVKDKTKLDLESLRAEILLKSNIKLTMEELQDYLISFAIDNKESFFDYVMKKFKMKNYEKMKEAIKDWGIDTSNIDVDSVIYDNP